VDPQGDAGRASHVSSFCEVGEAVEGCVACTFGGTGFEGLESVNMKLKKIITVVGVLVALGFAYSYANGARADAVAAEERVRVLEVERMELERQVEEATQG